NKLVFEVAHDDVSANLVSPAWCDDCGSLLLGLMQEAVQCSVCKRLACENCPRMQPCLPRGLLRYVHAGEENLPPVLRVLCADAELILLLAHDHPTVLRYAAEELWRRSDFLQGLLQLADGTESPQLRSEVEKQVLRRASAKPLAAQAVMAAVLKAETAWCSREMTFAPCPAVVPCPDRIPAWLLRWHCCLPWPTRTAGPLQRQRHSCSTTARKCEWQQ
ncbi:unnamed protein product, partial [Effrenium voratum]